jgi:hypothetical protein
VPPGAAPPRMPLSAGIPGAGCPTSAHSGAASATPDILPLPEV